MIFTGEHEFTIDAKQRLAVPAEIRSTLEAAGHGPGLYVLPGPNGALWIWPERTFEEMTGAIDASLLPAEETMDYEELLFPQAARLEVDKSGRVRVPERLLRRAGIGQSVMVLGMRDHLELRDPEEWKARLEDRITRQGEIVHRARQALAERERTRRRRDADSA